MSSVRLALDAMATRFELLLLGDDPVHLRAAGEEALREIARVETRCNFYQASSELSRINREATESAIRVSGPMLRLLMVCQSLHRETEGRFDPTVAPALARWGLRHRHTPGRIPSPDELALIRSSIGFDRILLDASNSTIRLPEASMQLDLGGIAKGWALDEASEVLLEAGVERALLHGGTSTVIGLGMDENNTPWQVGIEEPFPEPGSDRDWIFRVGLQGDALSVSGIHGKAVQVDGKDELVGHVIKPSTGEAISGKRLSIALHERATDADAWSTALLADPEWASPTSVRGTTFIKTDSGWTVTGGTPPTSRFPLLHY